MSSDNTNEESKRDCLSRYKYIIDLEIREVLSRDP